jgi:hypothetical protein
VSARLVRQERGAVLIQVAVGLVALLGFSALAVDYGILWVAREQAQSAADAGAIAAATTLAFDQMSILFLAPATSAGQTFGGSIPVWDKPGAVEVTFCQNAADPTCARVPVMPEPQVRSAYSAVVSVYRDNAHSNALPTYFAALFGVTAQEVRAQATATAVPANIATCVWPLAIPDNWQPLAAPVADDFANAHCGGDVTDLRCQPFQKYNPPVNPADTYVRPSTSSRDFTPTGYALALANPMAVSGIPTQYLNPQRFWELLQPDATTGLWQPARRGAAAAVQIGGDFAGSLTACNTTPVHIGDVLPLVATPPEWSDVTTAASRLIGEDGGASWDDANARITGSCAASGGCGAVSPRLVLLPMFDPDAYDQTRMGSADCSAGGGTPTPCIKVVNFIGMFLDSETNATQLVGHFTMYPGRDIDTTDCQPNALNCRYPFVGYRWAFLRTAVLTR